MADQQGMDILSLIETDHREVEDLFEQLEENAGSKKAEKIFSQIFSELSLHAHAEELVFYPAMQEYEKTKKYIEEAESEHNAVKILLEQMKSLKPSDSEFEVKFKHLKESVLHHVEEEENEIFEAVRECFDEQALVVLGKEFEQAKAKWEDDVKAAIARK